MSFSGRITPLENITMLSQLAENIFGRGWLYYYVQITTMLILYLAANTSYNGLPPLLSILAQDKYVPRYLGYRGERLSYSNGIIMLTLAAGALIWIFAGNVEHLISLYAIGVFLSFTIAQTGLVVYWRKKRDSGWKTRAVINGLGALTTGVVVLVIAESKFLMGAWMVLVFIPIMVYIFKKIRRHYDDMAEQLHLQIKKDNPFSPLVKGRNLVIVPIASPTNLVADTVRYAKSISDNIIALYVAIDMEEKERIRTRWNELNTGVPLVTIGSEYRLVIQPILDFIEKMEKEKKPEDYITVLIPEFETKKWWHRFLHNQTGWILRTLLILRDNVIVATIPYHLKK